jgi:protein N-terminal methyltransferase
LKTIFSRKDCGAGIGRVTKHLLIPIFSKVDLVEQSPNLLNYAQEFISNDKKLGKLYYCGLQKFIPEKKYGEEFKILKKQT